jgi:integrase
MTAIIPGSPQWESFAAAVPNPATRKEYFLCVRHFLQHAGMDNVEFAETALKDQRKAEDLVLAYIGHLKARVEKGELAPGSVRNRVKPVKLYCTMNRLKLDWEFISRTMPKGRRYADDRAPTREEIRRILNLCTLRIKIAVEFMASGGIRVGAWDYMSVRDVEPVMRGEALVAGRVTVYRGEPEQYVTFVTPEAYQLYSEYMDYRRVHGEEVAEGAPLIRDEFAVSRGRKGTASVVRRFPSNFVERELCRVLAKSGLRGEKRRRYDFKAAHGFRKWFKTQAEQVMKPANVEVLMGHSIGISDSYYRPTEKELLEDYLKAVPVLSVTEYRDVKEAGEKIRAEFGMRVAQLEAQLAEVLRRQAAAGR